MNINDGNQPYRRNSLIGFKITNKTTQTVKEEFLIGIG